MKIPVKYSMLLRPALSFSLLLPITSSLFSQDCTVERESLKGTYTGDCKKGKANGKGTANGTDTYEGSFKSGLPDGQGTYTWKNGDTFTGKFVKGLREGNGTMIYKRENAPDSTVKGYWKKDEYAGKYEKPYIIHYASQSIAGTDVQLKKDSSNRITFLVTNTSGGGYSLRGATPKMKVTQISLLTGNYSRTFFNDNNFKSTETILYDVLFPARMNVYIGSQRLDIEFLEEGQYIVTLRINL